jgi:hypothetical protein
MKEGVKEGGEFAGWLFVRELISEPHQRILWRLRIVGAEHC